MDNANQANENPGLSLQDLMLMRDAIKLASTRGAFQVEEFTAIGQVYQKLETFLETTKKQMQEAAANQEVNEEDAVNEGGE